MRIISGNDKEPNAKDDPIKQLTAKLERLGLRTLTKARVL